MDSTIGVLGAVVGLAIWGLGGAVAAKAAYDATVNEEQRSILRRLFAVGGAYTSTLMLVVLLVGLGLLPAWIYGLAFILWFGALLPALAWLHHRLDATESDTEAGSRLGTL
jgi:hypothetical protein